MILSLDPRQWPVEYVSLLLFQTASSLNLCPRDRLNKKYYNAAKISGFMVIIFENERFFGEPIYKEVVKGFVNAARDFGKLAHLLPCYILVDMVLDLGVTIEDPVPYVKWVVGRPDVNQVGSS